MSAEFVLQAVQIVGALLVLSGYVLAQAGRLSDSSVPYLLLNLLGSGALAVLAVIDRQWGFLLLEGVWAVVTAWSLVRRHAGAVGHRADDDNVTRG